MSLEFSIARADITRRIGEIVTVVTCTRDILESAVSHVHEFSSACFVADDGGSRV